MKIAVLFQSGLCMTASITRATHRCPATVVAGGCSDVTELGITHETDGRVPAAAALKNFAVVRISPSWWSALTVLNRGSGFQIVPWCGDIRTSLQWF